MMSDSQREFAKALSLVTRVNDERVATTSPVPLGSGRSSWQSAVADYQYSSISPPNSEDIDNMNVSDDDDDLFGGGFTDEAITDRLGRLRHLQRMSRKGKRQPNWSETENSILVEQFEKFQETLKPKRSEGISARDKKEAWESICAAVNANNAAALKRSAKDVRKKWENIRTWARKVITEWKHDCSQTVKSDCPPPDPPELARRIMVIYEGDGVDDGHDFDDDANSIPHATHADHEPKHTPSTPCHTHPWNEANRDVKDIKQVVIKNEDENVNMLSRPVSVTPPITRRPAAAPPLNVPTRRCLRGGLLDYRLLDAARMEERFQQHGGSVLDVGSGNGLSLAPSTSPSPPPPKKPRRLHQDDSKDIRELQREVLILQKEKLVMEKEKLQMEKDKLKIEKENLMLERHRLISSSQFLFPMMS